MTPARHRSPTTPLAGLVVCAHCGYRMRSKWGPDGPGYLYECEHPTCKTVSVTRKRCEAAVLEWLRREVAGEVEARAALTQSHRASTTVARTEAEHLARQVQRLDDALTRLTKDRAMGLVPEQAYATARDELVTERDQAATALEAASLTVARPGPDLAVAVRLIEDWDVLPVQDRRRMLEPLVRVRVTKGKPKPVVDVVPAWVV